LGPRYPAQIYPFERDVPEHEEDGAQTVLAPGRMGSLQKTLRLKGGDEALDGTLMISKHFSHFFDVPFVLVLTEKSQNIKCFC
jgi:hypothetical protein